MASEVSEIRLSGFLHTKTRRTLRWSKRFARLYSNGVVDLFNAGSMGRGLVVRQARLNVLGLRVSTDATPYSSRPFSLQLDTSFHGILVFAFADEREMVNWATEIVRVILRPSCAAEKTQRLERISEAPSMAAEKEDFVTTDEPLMSAKASLTAVRFALALNIGFAAKNAIREQEKAATRLRLNRKESWDAHNLTMEQLAHAQEPTRKRLREERMSRRFDMPTLGHSTSQSSDGHAGFFAGQIAENAPCFEDAPEQYEEYTAGRSSVLSHEGPSRQGSIELQAPVPRRHVGMEDLPPPLQVTAIHRRATSDGRRSPTDSPMAPASHPAVSLVSATSRYLRFLRTLTMSRADRFAMRAVIPSFGSFASACILPEETTSFGRAARASVRRALEDIAQRFLHDPDAANPMVERIADKGLLRLIDSLWFQTRKNPKMRLERGVTEGASVEQSPNRHSVQPTIRRNDRIPMSKSPPPPSSGKIQLIEPRRGGNDTSALCEKLEDLEKEDGRRTSIAMLAEQTGIPPEQIKRLAAAVGGDALQPRPSGASECAAIATGTFKSGLSRIRFRKKLLNALSDLVSLYFSFEWDDPSALLAANRRKDKAEVDEKDESRGKQLWRRLKVLWYRRRATNLLKAQREFRTLGYMLKIAQSSGVSNALSFNQSRNSDVVPIDGGRAEERLVCRRPQAFRLNYLPNCSKDEAGNDAIFEGRQTRAPVVLFLGGGMGAGKSSILREVASQDPWSTLLADAIIIEADKIKMNDPIFRYLAGKEENAHGIGELASYVHSFSTSAANKMLLAAVRAGRDVIMDGTLTWYEYVRQTVNMVKNAHRYEYRIGPGFEDGKVERYWEVTNELCLDEQQRRKQYEVHIVGVCCEPHLAVSRGLRRKLLTGRGVPISPQLRSHKLFSENFCKYVKMVDFICLYDTSEFGAPRLIAKKFACPGKSFLVLPQRFLAFLKFRNTNIKAKSYLELYDQSASTVEDYDAEKLLPHELRDNLSGNRRVFGEEILWAEGEATGAISAHDKTLASRVDGAADEEDVSGFCISTQIGLSLSVGFASDAGAAGDTSQEGVLRHFGLRVDEELREALAASMAPSKRSGHFSRRGSLVPFMMATSNAG